MADITDGKITNIELKSYTSSEGKPYQRTFLTVNNKVFNTFTSKLPKLNTNEFVSIVYQSVSKKDTNGTQVTHNNIISLEVLKESINETKKLTKDVHVNSNEKLPWEKQEMAKQTTSTTATQTTTESSGSKFFKITGKTHFAHVKEPDTKGKFPTNKYKMDLIIDSETAKRLTSRGVLVKTREGVSGSFVTLKSTFQPTVLDSEGVQLTEVPLIGNNSEVTVTVALYSNKAPNGGKNCLGMNSIVLNKLVRYEAPNLLDLDE